jgi:MFS family permease
MLEPPSGGSRGATDQRFLGWRMVAVAALGVFLAGPAQTYGVSVFVDPMRDEFGWSRSLVSLSYSVATLIGACAVFVTGRLLDRYGHRVLLTGTALAFGAALLAMSAVDGSWSLALGFAFLRATGIGALLLTSRTLAAQWFSRRRGRALSLVALGGSLSLALVPVANDLLIDAAGWRDAWRINGLVIWLALVPVAAIVVRGRPEDVGQLPDGQTVLAAEMDSFAEVTWAPAQAIRTTSFWILLGASLVPGLVNTGLDFNQITIFTDRGMSSTIAAAVFTISAVTAVAASLLAGGLVDRVPPRYVLAIGQGTLALATLVFLFARSPEWAFLYGATRGAALGVWAVAIDATWPAYFGRGRLGSIRGMTFGAEILGAALGPLPFGLVYDAVGSYTLAIVGVLVLPAIAAAAVMRAVPPRPMPDDVAIRAA